MPRIWTLIALESWHGYLRTLTVIEAAVPSLGIIVHICTTERSPLKRLQMPGKTTLKT